MLGWVKADNGWAFNGVLPSNVEYTLETPYLLTQMRILTGMERTNHIITSFIIEASDCPDTDLMPQIRVLIIASTTSLFGSRLWR